LLIFKSISIGGSAFYQVQKGMFNDDQDEHFSTLREQMVTAQLEERGIEDALVLKAMRHVPRHLYVPKKIRNQAYHDKALPLGPQETISQPYVVALMLEALELKPSDHVLEIGTGSGYQTALLAEIVTNVYSIDINKELVDKARDFLGKAGYENAEFRASDGERGWPDKAPFDAIIVSAACSTIPRDLVKQLALNGRMVLPLGEETQFLVVLEKKEDGLDSRELGPVRFVRMQKTRV